MKVKLGLLYGGKSAEHKVSLQTALAVTKALDMTKFDVYPIYITDRGEWIRGGQLEAPAQEVKELELSATEHVISPVSLNKELFPAHAAEEEQSIDVIFPLLHGPNGEDGTVQGLLELMNIPYVGNGVLSSAAGMDKVIMKKLFAQAGLKQAKYVSFIRKEWEQQKGQLSQEIEERLGYPCFVKPANLGSSVGISKCRNREELETACVEAFQFDRKVIVEEGIVGKEIEIGILGNDDPECSVAGEIAPKKDFYDYKAKYEDGETALIIPANLSGNQYADLKEKAILAFKAIDGAGLVRADFFLTVSGEFLINEVNTMPGFTPFSMFPLMWQHTGISYPQLIERLVSLALERHAQKQHIKHTF
jgi:D-alanine-D-alanine ligase